MFYMDYLIESTILQADKCYGSHFIADETEAQSSSLLVQGPTASR